MSERKLAVEKGARTNMELLQDQMVNSFSLNHVFLIFTRSDCKLDVSGLISDKDSNSLLLLVGLIYFYSRWVKVSLLPGGKATVA
jgi:hypothetical protein